MSTMEKGKLSIHTENILPVIKKWLYSENEIFVRELISNAQDAIEKLKKVALGEDIFQADRTEYAVDVRIDREKGVLEFEDNGIGMTADEVRRYITQIAFSGAEEFAQKYLKADGTAPAGADIIGHFGLGFYSSFMVAAKVEIESRSYRPDAESVLWISDGSEEFEIGSGSRADRGTLIRLHLHEEFRERYLDQTKVQELVKRFCDFLPVPIRVNGAIFNRQQPLWTRHPTSVKREEYIEFYKYLFPFQQDPLFYIHLNVDYPFRLQGILYFPHLAHEMDLNRSEVKLYCKQVFVTDEAQEVVPKFLTVLQGVIDLPELPLNVSRSYIQNDPEVKKIATHIVKKVADRLVEEFKKNRTEYEKIWSEISPFVKYGMLSDERFFEQSKEALLLRVLDAEKLDEKRFATIDEYQQKNKDRAGERVFYASDLKTQGPAARLLQNQGIDVVLLDTMIDSHFTSHLEMRLKEVRFVRVDAELSEHAVEADSGLVDADAKSLKERVEAVFRSALPDTKITIRVENLKSDDIPAMVLLPEQMRRVSEMAVLWGQEGGGKFPEHHTLLVNLKNDLVRRLGAPSLVGTGTDEKKSDTALQIYRLARLSQGALSPEEMQTAAKDLFAYLAKTL